MRMMLWVLAWLVCVTTVLSQTVDVRLVPAVAVAVEGSSFSWHCIIDRNGNPHPVNLIRWRFEDADIIMSPTKYVLGNGTLYIPYMMVSDVGLYQCLVYVDNNIYYSARSYLQMAYLGPITTQPSSQEKHIGDAITLLCGVRGAPMPIFSWIHNGYTATRGVVTMVSETLSMLQITSAQYEDAGEYYCIARNTLLPTQLTTNTANITLEGAPMLTTTPAPQSVLEGTSALFNCSAHANPPPNIAWVHTATNSIIDDSSKYTVFSNGSLLVSDVRAQDLGFYTCRATNEWGSAEVTVLLAFNTYEGENLRFVEYPQDAVVTAGETVFWTCSATGYPTPTISWSKLYGSLPADHEIPYMGALQLNAVSPDVAGIYVCTATSGSRNTSYSVLLEVNVKPEFVSPPQSIIVNKGDSYQLDCIVVGSPTPIIDWWLPDGEVVTFPAYWPYDNEQVLQNGTLRVSKATEEHAGTHTCFAQNDVGIATADVNVFVKYAPQIAMVPMETRVIQGQDAVLSCVAVGYPHPVISWRWSEQDAVLVDDDVHDLLANGSLRIHSMQSWLEGVYTCLATSDLGQDQASANVYMIVMPSFLEENETLVVPEAFNVTLDCTVEGVPTPHVQWMKGTETLVVDMNMQIFANNTLFIANIETRQYGGYSCLATNDAGHDVLIYTIARGAVPVFTVTPQNTTVAIYESATLRCAATATQSTTFRWRHHRDDVTLASYPDDEDADTYVTQDGDLVLQNVTSTDAGWYVCEASNYWGSSLADAYLDVKVPPVITLTVLNKTVVEGEATVLNCPNVADPPATLSWETPQGIPVTMTTDAYHLTEDGVVVVAASVDSDFGTWWCQACNDIGCDRARSNLIVLGGPAINHVFAWQDQSESTYVRCNAIGVPAPEVTYYWGQVEVTEVNPPADHALTPEGFLRIDRALTSSYSCLATNDQGQYQLNLNAPAPPINVRVIEVSNTSATLQWEAGGGIPYDPTWYTVQFWAEGLVGPSFATFVTPRTSDIYLDVTVLPPDPAESPDDVPQNFAFDLDSVLTNVPYSIRASLLQNDLVTGEEPYILDNLLPFALYKFEVQARNIFGESQYTTAVEASTAEGVPGRVVVLKTEYYAGRVIVTWQPPTHLNAPPSHIQYHVQYKDNDISSVYRSLYVGVQPPHEIAIFDINYDVIMEVKVTTFNTNLRLESEEERSFIYVQVEAPVEAPSRVRVTYQEEEEALQIDWQGIDDNTVEGFVIAYALVGANAQPTSFQFMEVYGRRTSSAVIGQIQTEAAYDVEVAAFNDAGDGPYSAAVRAYTGEGSGFLLDESEQELMFIILGVVLGCIFLILLIVIIYCCCVRCHHRKQGRKEKSISIIYDGKHASEAANVYENPSMEPSSSTKQVVPKPDATSAVYDVTATPSIYENEPYRQEKSARGPGGSPAKRPVTPGGTSMGNNSDHSSVQFGRENPAYSGEIVYQNEATDDEVDMESLQVSLSLQDESISDRDSMDVDVYDSMLGSVLNLPIEDQEVRRSSPSSSHKLSPLKVSATSTHPARSPSPSHKSVRFHKPEDNTTGQDHHPSPVHSKHSMPSTVSRSNDTYTTQPLGGSEHKQKYLPLENISDDDKVRLEPYIPELGYTPPWLRQDLIRLSPRHHRLPADVTYDSRRPVTPDAGYMSDPYMAAAPWKPGFVPTKRPQVHHGNVRPGHNPYKKTKKQRKDSLKDNFILQPYDGNSNMSASKQSRPRHLYKKRDATAAMF